MWMICFPPMPVRSKYRSSPILAVSKRSRLPAASENAPVRRSLVAVVRVNPSAATCGGGSAGPVEVLPQPATRISAMAGTRWRTVLMDHLAVLSVTLFTLYTEMGYLEITRAYSAQCNFTCTKVEQHSVTALV